MDKIKNILTTPIWEFKAFKWGACSVLAYSFTDPMGGVHIVEGVLFFHHGFILWYAFFRSGWHLKDGFYPLIDKMQESRDMKKISSETIEGIPKDNLIRYIIDTRGFKVQGFCDNFGIKFGATRNSHKRLGKKFDDIGVFDRGENNERVLRQDVTEKTLFDHLATANTTDEISGFIINRNT